MYYSIFIPKLFFVLGKELKFNSFQYGNSQVKRWIQFEGDFEREISSPKFKLVVFVTRCKARDDFEHFLRMIF